MYITFDIIFGSYLPRGTKIMGPRNVGWGLFAQLQKFQVKCEKIGQKLKKIGPLTYGI